MKKLIKNKNLIIMILCIKKYPKSIHQTFVQMLIFLAVNAIFSSIRLNLLLLQFAHSIYLSLIPLLVCWVYFIYTDNKFLEQYNLKRFIAAALVFLSIINLTILFNAKHRIYAELETNKGNISTVKTHVKVFQNTINWIFTNTKTDNTVVMLPEGPMINFLTGRKTNNLYYHLIPNHIAALGEDNIIKDIAFTGEACAISISSASIMTTNLKDKSVSAALNYINNMDNMLNDKKYDPDVLKEAVVYVDNKNTSRKTCCWLPYQGAKDILESTKK